MLVVVVIDADRVQHGAVCIVATDPAVAAAADGDVPDHDVRGGQDDSAGCHVTDVDILEEHTGAFQCHCADLRHRGGVSADADSTDGGARDPDGQCLLQGGSFNGGAGRVRSDHQGLGRFVVVEGAALDGTTRGHLLELGSVHPDHVGVSRHRVGRVDEAPVRGGPVGGTRCRRRAVVEDVVPAIMDPDGPALLPSVHSFASVEPCRFTWVVLQGDPSAIRW